MKRKAKQRRRASHCKRCANRITQKLKQVSENQEKIIMRKMMTSETGIPEKSWRATGTEKTHTMTDTSAVTETGVAA
eukprot:scaffold567_cov14-Prasinocladus_malaysianus.AAC.1